MNDWTPISEVGISTGILKNWLFEVIIISSLKIILPLFSTVRFIVLPIYFFYSIYISDWILLPKKTISLCFTSEIKLSL